VDGEDQQTIASKQGRDGDSDELQTDVLLCLLSSSARLCVQQ